MKRKEVKPEHQEWIKKVGAKIKELRLSKEHTYIAMAEKIGISRNAYNAIEIGNDYFNISTLLQILDYHEINMREFILSL